MKMKTSKFGAIVASLAAITLALSGCGASADEAPEKDGSESGSNAVSGPLRVYSAYEDQQLQPLVDVFEKANPDIDVQLFHQPGEQLSATLSLEFKSGNPKADIVGLNEASLNGLQNEYGAFVEYEPAGYADIQEESKTPGGFITPSFFNVYLIHYNTNSIPEADAPTSWSDLLDPKWKDQIAMADPSASQSIQSFIWFITEQLGDEGSPYGWEYFDALSKQNVSLQASHGTIRDLVVSGERPLGVQLLANGQQTFNAGEPTGIVWPSEGSPGELSGFSMVKDSPNQAAAELWLDFVVSEDAQALIPESLGGAPVRVDADYTYPGGTPLSDVNVVRVDADYVGENQESQTTEFLKRMGN